MWSRRCGFCKRVCTSRAPLLKTTPPCLGAGSGLPSCARHRLPAISITHGAINCVQRMRNSRRRPSELAQTLGQLDDLSPRACKHRASVALVACRAIRLVELYPRRFELLDKTWKVHAFKPPIINLAPPPCPPPPPLIP